MQAVIELTVSLVSALAMAVLAQLGVDADQRREQPSVERVVARSPEGVAAPHKATICPDEQRQIHAQTALVA